MPQCCVPKCKALGVHRFPRDPLRQAEWVKAIRKDNFKPDQSSRICKSHFVPEDYVKEKSFGARALLKKSAVPSQFSWTSNPSLESNNEVKGNAKLRRRKLPEKGTFQLQKRRASKRRKMALELDKLNENTTEIGELNEKTTEAEKVNQNISSEKDSENLMSIVAVHSVLDNTDENGADNLTDVINKDGQKDSDETAECRACLQQLRVDRLFSLFQGWAPHWEKLGTTIAEDLTNLSDVQLSETDIHSKFICYTCCEKLWNACHFKTLVQDNDRILQQRIPDNTDRVWPKPIQVDKSINVFDNNLPFNVDIKQEVLSDEEACNIEEMNYTDVNLMDIKVEPEEIVEQPPILVNGVTSLKEFPQDENTPPLLNGDAKHYEVNVKEEPVSDAEDTGLPLECLLCMRSFHSMTGLKAHVIAQHSYVSVARGAGGAGEGKHVCATCRRTFTTSTDLMVHETCHNKHVCYGCNAKFDSFSGLSVHRRRCKAIASAEVTRPKTLDDVIRPPADDSLLKPRQTKEVNANSPVKDSRFSCPVCNEIFTDMYYVKIHLEVHHSIDSSTNVNEESTPMEIEVLESLFNEDT